MKVGSLVKKGDVVLRLDDTQMRIELGIVQSQIAQLKAMMVRLVAERDGVETLSFDGLELTPEVTREERKLFDENRDMRANQKQQIEMQISQLRNQIDGLRERRRGQSLENDLLPKNWRCRKASCRRGSPRPPNCAA